MDSDSSIAAFILTLQIVHSFCAPLTVTSVANTTSEKYLSRDVQQKWTFDENIIDNRRQSDEKPENESSGFHQPRAMYRPEFVTNVYENKKFTTKHHQFAKVWADLMMSIQRYESRTHLNMTSTAGVHSLRESASKQGLEQPPQHPEKFRHRQRRRTQQCDPDVVVPLVAYEGQEVKLQCKTCPQSKRINPIKEGLQWRTQSRTSPVEEKISLRMEVKKRLSIKYKDMTLIIRRAEEQHAGKYYCYQKGTYLSNYDVTVLPKPEFHLVSENGDQPYPDDTDDDGRLVMYSNWGEWSTCNHCNTPGERIRIGYCYAMVLSDQFPNGLPCRSGIVPYSKRREFAKRKDEKMIESCSEPCPKDKNAGIGKKILFIPFGGAKPTLPSFVSRKAIYAERGSELALGCPTVEFDKAVRWQNGSSPMRVLDLHKNKFVRKQTRMYIDELDVLHIHNLTDTDAGVYSCWQDDRSLATTKLIIVEPLIVDEKMKGQLLYSGFLFTGIIVAMIGFGVFKNQERVK